MKPKMTRPRQVITQPTNMAAAPPSIEACAAGSATKSHELKMASSHRQAVAAWKAHDPQSTAAHETASSVSGMARGEAAHLSTRGG